MLVLLLGHTGSTLFEVLRLALEPPMHRLNSVYRSVALLVLLCGASSPRAELITIDTTISAKVTSLTALGGSTVGTINSGILAGATAFSATFTDAAGDYVGTLVDTTADGTLSLADVGGLNFSTFAFTDKLTVTSGTGIFAGTSGALADQGSIDPATLSFTNVPLTGTISVPEPASLTLFSLGVAALLTYRWRQRSFWIGGIRGIAVTQA
jgi:hypothetical protein